MSSLIEQAARRLEQLRQNICSQATKMLQLTLVVFTPQEPKP